MSSNMTDILSTQATCHLPKLQRGMTDPELGILSYWLSF